MLLRRKLFSSSLPLCIVSHAVLTLCNAAPTFGCPTLHTLCPSRFVVRSSLLESVLQQDREQQLTMIESGDHRLYQLIRDRQRPRIAFQMVFANFDGKIGWQQDPKWTLFEQNRLARQLLKNLAQLDDRLAVGGGCAHSVLDDMRKVCSNIDWASVKLPARAGEAERLIDEISANLADLASTCA